MSSVRRGAWRRPEYVVTALTSLLANEVLHNTLVHTALQPPTVHGPSSHTDRTFTDLVTVFDSDGTRVGGDDNLVVVVLTNGSNVIVRFQARVPQGAVSLDTIAALVDQPGSAVAAGVAQFSLVSVIMTEGTIAIDVDPQTAAVAIPAGGADAVLRSLTLSDVSVSMPGAPRFVRVRIRRDSSVGADTFEGDLNLVGALLTWTLDE